MDPRTLQALPSDPSLHLHQIDVTLGRALIVRLSREASGKAAFLDERVLESVTDGGWIALDELPAFTPDAAVSRFVFHIGHCGSTLLSRLLQQWPGVVGLREPLALRNLAELYQSRNSALSRLDPVRWPTLCMTVLGMLGRQTHANERVVIKATSNCNELIAPIWQLLPTARGIFLWIPLEDYLATILKSDGARRDALGFAGSRLAWLHTLAHTANLRLYQMSEAEMITLGWVAEMKRLESLQGHANLLEIDFSSLLTNPIETLCQIAAHLALDADRNLAQHAWSSPVSRQYAKADSHAYRSEDREHDLTLAKQRFRHEIAQGRRWLDSQNAALHPSRGL